VGTLGHVLIGPELATHNLLAPLGRGLARDRVIRFDKRPGVRMKLLIAKALPDEGHLVV
jgi:hypothetical protein